MARTIPTADTRSGALACPEERRAPARVLRSPLIGEDLEALAVEVEGLRAGLCAEERGVLEPLLFADVFSEYDARHLWAWLQGLELELSAPFLRCAEGWAADEELHFRDYIYQIIKEFSEKRKEVFLDSNLVAFMNDVSRERRPKIQDMTASKERSSVARAF